MDGISCSETVFCPSLRLPGSAHCNTSNCLSADRPTNDSFLVERSRTKLKSAKTAKTSILSHFFAQQQLFSLPTRFNGQSTTSSRTAPRQEPRQYERFSVENRMVTSIGPRTAKFPNKSDKISFRFPIYFIRRECCLSVPFKRTYTYIHTPWREASKALKGRLPGPEGLGTQGPGLQVPSGPSAAAKLTYIYRQYTQCIRKISIFFSTCDDIFSTLTFAPLRRNFLHFHSETFAGA